jgi:hypothetical protein
MEILHTGTNRGKKAIIEDGYVYRQTNTFPAIFTTYMPFMEGRMEIMFHWFLRYYQLKQRSVARRCGHSLQIIALRRI